MPLVSVVVPNYNYARYLPERMESIFSQTFQDYEVILLDDCSTDNSKEIIEQYRNHPKVSAIVYNDQNSGSPFKQWRKGVEMAKGKYVWIAESDDSAKPEFLATGVNLLEENPEAVLAFMGADIMDGDGKSLMRTLTAGAVNSHLQRVIECLTATNILSTICIGVRMCIMRAVRCSDANGQLPTNLRFAVRCAMQAIGFSGQ